MSGQQTNVPDAQAAEQPIITVTVKNDSQTYKNATSFLNRKIKRRLWLYMIEVVLGLCIVGSFEPDVLNMLCLFLIGTLFGFVLVYFNALLLPSKRYKKAQILYDGETTFSFFADNVFMRYSTAACVGERTYPYSAFSNVQESKDFFFPCLVNNQYYTIPKRDLTPEQTIALKEFFSQRFGEKFKPLKGKR